MRLKLTLPPLNEEHCVLCRNKALCVTHTHTHTHTPAFRNNINIKNVALKKENLEI